MGGNTAEMQGVEKGKMHAEVEQRVRRKLVRSLYSALLHLTHDFDKNIHPRKQPWLEIDSLLSAFGAVPTEFGMMRSTRDVFTSKKGETNPEEVERLINEGFAVLKQLSTSYSDIIPWASLFQNKMNRERIDRDVMVEDGAVTVARLAGRNVQFDQVRAELDKIAGLVRDKLDAQPPPLLRPPWPRHSTVLAIKKGEKAKEEKVLAKEQESEDKWTLNPWEEQAFGKSEEAEPSAPGREEAWRLDPFQVKLPSECMYGERKTPVEADSQVAGQGRNEGRSIPDVLDALNKTLYDELGFYGVPGDQWGQAESNFVDAVLRLKGGIPLSLSVVYMSVARRLGVRLDGLNVPAHFLLYSAEADSYIDAYNDGKRMSPHEATEFVSVLLRHNSASGPMLQKTPQLRFTRNDLDALQRVNTFGISSRMVRNLYAASVNDYGLGSEEAQRWLRQMAILQNW